MGLFTSSSTRSALRYGFLLANILTSSGSPLCEPTEAEQRCNGRSDLCDRHLSEVAFAGTHNSFTTTTYGFPIVSINQNNNIAQQLSDGIRYLNFDVYPDETSPNPSQTLVLCHSLCSGAKIDFGEQLVAVVEFLQANKNEVLVINMEDKANTSAIVAKMEETGLAAYAHTYNTSAPLTLREMIALDKRVLVMRQNSISCMQSSAPECEAPAWMHYTWALSKRTEWEFRDIDSFNCNVRKPSEGPFFMISHWINPALLTMLTSGREPSATSANQWDVLQRRVQQCWAEVGSFPNFVVVDFYDHGHNLQVVDWLNENSDMSLAEIAATSNVPLPNSTSTTTPPPCTTEEPSSAPSNVPLPNSTSTTAPPPRTTEEPSSAHRTGLLHMIASPMSAVVLLVLVVRLL